MMAIGATGSLIGATAAGFLGEIVPILLLVVVQGSGYVIGSLTVAWLTRGQRVPTTRLSPEGQPALD